MSNPKLWALIEFGAIWHTETSLLRAKFVDTNGHPCTTIVEYVPAPQWRPVNEPPHDGDEVLCHRVADGHLVPWSSVLTYLDGGRWVRREGNHERLLAPTHWMPLPDPPEVGT